MKDELFYLSLQHLYLRIDLLQDRFDTTAWWQWALRKRLHRRAEELSVTIYNLEQEERATVNSLLSD